MADQWAATSLMPSELNEDIHKVRPSIKVTNLDPPYVFKDISRDSFANCMKSIISDVYLKIRHGWSLHLLNILWKIPKVRTACLILGRGVLESIAYDNTILLEAVSNNNDGVIDVSKKIENEDHEKLSTGQIGAILGGFLHRSCIINDEVGVEKSLECSQFGEDPKYKIDLHLYRWVRKATEKGNSKQECDRLQSIRKEHKHLFKLRLRSGGSANMTPVKINLDVNKKVVRVRVRRYPAEQRAILKSYVCKIV